MKERFLERILDSLTFVSGGSSSLQLPRNHIYQALVLRFFGTVTKGAATVGKKSFTPARLLKKIEIVANGRDVLKSLTGALLTVMNRYDYGTDPVLSDVIDGPSTDNFEIILRLPFKNTHAVHPMDSFLDSRRLDSLDLKIDWGTIADLFGTPGVGVITTATCQIETEEQEGAPADKLGFLTKHSYSTKIVDATRSDLQELITVGSMYRRFIFVCENNDIVSNTILNALQFRHGTFVYKNVRVPTLRGKNKFEYAIEALEDGVVILDLISDGSNSELIDLRGVRETVDLLLDVTKSVVPGSVEKIYIMKEEVIA